jgi:tetratricopeptide (TPR) repeat protein
MDRVLLDSYMETDSLQKALALADVMKSKKIYENYRDEILFKKAMVLSRLGRYDEAIDILKELTINLDSSTVASDTSQIRARALYELAVLYQKKKNDMENADKYFTLSSLSRDTLNKEISKKRISALEKLKKLRESNDSLDGPPLSRKYKIAELFKYELDVPDSAYYHYLELVKDSSADSEFVPKAISAAAMVARDQMNDTLKAEALQAAYLQISCNELAKNSEQQGSQGHHKTDRNLLRRVLQSKDATKKRDVKGAVADLSYLELRSVCSNRGTPHCPQESYVAACSG